MIETRLLVRGSICWAWLWLGAACEPADAPKKEAELHSGDEVTATEVVKGDEIVVEKGGRSARVRLLGIHAFAEGAPDDTITQLAQQSATFMKEAVVGKKVTIELGPSAKDVHGRYLGYVHRDGRDVNAQSLAEGFSVVYTEYGFERENAYLQAESAARLAKRNIWSSEGLGKVVQGLRKQWSEARRRRDGSGVSDPLLATEAG